MKRYVPLFSNHIIINNLMHNCVKTTQQHENYGQNMTILTKKLQPPRGCNKGVPPLREVTRASRPCGM